MADKAIFVWRYDYDMKEGSTWVAHVAGYTEDQCRDYLFKIVGRNVKISSISQICRLDAISDEFRTVIVESAMPSKKKPGRPPKEETVKRGPGRPPKVTTKIENKKED
jgi:hypothetical protein